MRIICPDARQREALDAFIAEWESESEYIEAHTSGSTGKPKSIRLMKHDMIASALSTNEFFSIDSQSVLLMPLSVDYIAGKMMVVRALMASCTLIVETPSRHPFASDYGMKVTLLPIVPAQIEGLLESPLVSPDNISNLLVGGAPMSSGQESRLMKEGFNAFVSYGMTETCSHVALRRLGDDVYHSMPGVWFSVDEESCLVIHSMFGKYSWSELRTNDVVEMCDSQSFRWRGRRDNVINSGGVKIFPEEEEKKLAGRIAGRFYICGKDDAEWGTAVVLVVEGRKSQEEIRGIEKICKDVLHPYACPKRIMCVDSIKTTESGKLKREQPDG